MSCPPRSRSVRVLLAADDDAARELVRGALAQAGIEVDLADSEPADPALAAPIREPFAAFLAHASGAALARQIEFEQTLIGIVTHDLRNPLQAMIMGAQAALMRADVHPALAKTLARIAASGDRAARMISDLVDFSRARSSGGLSLARRDMDMHEAVRRAVDDIAEEAPERTVVVETTDAGRGHWDPDRLAQAVATLVANALAYGAAGTPVTVRTIGQAERVLLEIHNLGPAIPPELLPTLFEPFRRPKESASRRRSLGIGLYLAREIALAHGGDIEVDSQPDIGTTFRIRLPR